MVTYTNSEKNQDSNMKQNKIDEALQEVKLLIDLLNSRIQDAENRVLFFEHQGLGSLHLNYEEYLRYSRCLENLVKSSVKDEDLSIKSVESTFQEALLTAFYFSKILTIDNNLTQEEILNDLKQKLLGG